MNAFPEVGIYFVCVSTVCWVNESDAASIRNVKCEVKTVCLSVFDEFYLNEKEIHIVQCCMSAMSTICYNLKIKQTCQQIPLELDI